MVPYEFCAGTCRRHGAGAAGRTGPASPWAGHGHWIASLEGRVPSLRPAHHLPRAAQGRSGPASPHGVQDQRGQTSGPQAQGSARWIPSNPFLCLRTAVYKTAFYLRTWVGDVFLPAPEPPESFLAWARTRAACSGPLLAPAVALPGMGWGDSASPGKGGACPTLVWAPGPGRHHHEQPSASSFQKWPELTSSALFICFLS